jgi:hypothetical protein
MRRTTSHSKEGETYLPLLDLGREEVWARLPERDPFPSGHFKNQVSFELYRGQELLDLQLFDLKALRQKGLGFLAPPEPDGSVLFTIERDWRWLWRRREVRVPAAVVRRATAWAYLQLYGEPEPLSARSAQLSRPSGLAG